MSIEARLKTIIVQHLGIEPDKVKPEATLIDDLGADSLDMVELVMATEEEFGVSINDDDAEHVMTFGDMVKLVEKSAVRQ